MESYTRIDDDDHRTGRNMLTYKPYRELRAEILAVKKRLASYSDCPMQIIDKFTDDITANTIKYREAIDAKNDELIAETNAKILEDTKHLEGCVSRIGIDDSYFKYLLNIIIQTSIKLNQMKLRNPLGESRQFPSKKSELLSHYPKVESPYDQLGGSKKSKRSNKSKRSKKRRSLRK
jgi:hypothetical protein